MSKKRYDLIGYFILTVLVNPSVLQMSAMRSIGFLLLGLAHPACHSLSLFPPSSISY